MKRFIFIGILVGLFSIQTIAQPINKMTTTRMINIAEKAAAASNYYKALEWYQKTYDSSRDVNLLAQLATMNHQLRDYDAAIAQFEKYFKSAANKMDHQNRLDYAKTLKMMGRYEEAQSQLELASDGDLEEVFLKSVKLESAGIELAQISKVADLVTIENVGNLINTPNSEYSPFLAADGKLYYSSLLKNEIVEVGKNNKSTDYGTKLMVAHSKGNGYDKPLRLGNGINSENAFNSNISLSTDGQEMLIVQQQLGDGSQLKESVIYYSKMNKGTWSSPKKVSSINDDSINKSAAFGELYGKAVVFFVSNRAGGNGGYDLYYADYKGNGKCGEAVNLGNTINTMANEESPFYQDGQLYFSSTGYMSMGGYDIYQSTWNGRSWSNPENVGKPFNSAADDLYFMLNATGDKGVLASNRPDANAQSLKAPTCCNDIYIINIEKIEVDLLATIFDNDTGTALNGASVSLKPTQGDLETLEQTNKNTHEFQFPLEEEMSYTIIVNVAGYEPQEVALDVLKMTESTTIEKTINLVPIPIVKPEPKPEYITVTREEAITLENILYDYNDDKITASAENDLRLLYDLLVQYPDMVIELSSHTDARGGASFNEKLSQRRADSAVRWLLGKGIAAERLQSIGYGFTQPKVVNSTINSKHAFLPFGQALTEEYINQLSDEDLEEIAHQLNRRTEFKIISGPTSIRIEERKLKKN